MTITHLPEVKNNEKSRRHNQIYIMGIEVIMEFKYLIISTTSTAWGKNELSKEYFVNAVQRGDLIINLEDGTYFDKDENAWKEIRGDQ